MWGLRGELRVEWVGVEGVRDVGVDLEGESCSRVTEECLGGGDGCPSCQEQGSVDATEVVDAAAGDTSSIAESMVEARQVVAADRGAGAGTEQELVSVTSCLEAALDELLGELRERDGAE